MIRWFLFLLPVLLAACIPHAAPAPPPDTWFSSRERPAARGYSFYGVQPGMPLAELRGLDYKSAQTDPGCFLLDTSGTQILLETLPDLQTVRRVQGRRQGSLERDGRPVTWIGDSREHAEKVVGPFDAWHKDSEGHWVRLEASEDRVYSIDIRLAKP